MVCNFGYTSGSSGANITAACVYDETTKRSAWRNAQGWHGEVNWKGKDWKGGVPKCKPVAKSPLPKGPGWTEPRGKPMRHVGQMQCARTFPSPMGSCIRVATSTAIPSTSRVLRRFSLVSLASIFDQSLLG